MGTYQRRIVQKLSVLNPVRLVVRDVSHLHQHHEAMKNIKGIGETHFELEIVSASFSGKSLLQRQRRVYGLLRDELNEHVHALSMKTKTPSEDAPDPTCTSTD